MRNTLSLLNASVDEPSSTTQIEFKLENDEDTENSEPFFDNDFLDETSQQSSNNQLIDPIGQFANASSSQYPSTNSVESNQSDTNNNLIHSNAQLFDQGSLSFNNSINFNAGQNQTNYSIMNSISNSPNNPIPIQNLVIKENLLYQTVGVHSYNFHPITVLVSLVDRPRSNFSSFLLAPSYIGHHEL